MDPRGPLASRPLAHGPRQNWRIEKPVAHGQAIVVSQARDAALAGIAMLEAGGNAVDAAVATALALAAVEPWNSGLGGIGFAVVHRAGQKRAVVVDFGPRAPAGLNPARFVLTGTTAADLFGWPGVVDDANIHGPLSFVVPAAVAGYGAMHERWGRLPWAEVIAPAVALARRGLPVDWFTSLKVTNAAALLRRYDETSRIYLPGGLPVVPPYQGTPGFFALGRLADTFERLGQAGWRDFYTGEIAASLVADTVAMGGVLGVGDMAACAAQFGPALDIPWGGAVLQAVPGPTAGPTLADVIGRLPGGALGATWFAGAAQAMRAAYAVRLAAEPVDGCTSHLTVRDAEGTMVAMTTTLLSSFGSRVVLPGTGVLMNNGVMWFDPRPGKPNGVAPGRRPLCNMCPVVLRQDDAPVLAAGASGGRRIMAAVMQTVAFAHLFGMDAAAVAHHPRIDVSDPDVVHADMRLPDDVLAALRGQGAVEVVEHAVLPVNFACPNVIMREGAAWAGVSDVMSPWSAAVGLG